MSYCIQDKYGGLAVSYHPPAGTGGTAAKTWWPDYGPSSREFSHQPSAHPSHSIFENVTKHHTYFGTPGAPKAPAVPDVRTQVNLQFRHPRPAREAILSTNDFKVAPALQAKLAAHETTEKQASLKRLEHRQRRIDAWLGDPPIRAGASPQSVGDAPTRSRSENSLMSSVAASEASRAVYERHGFLVGRHKGSVADGLSGARPRRSNSLSFNAMMLNSELLSGPRGRSGSRFVEKKPSKQWKLTPESKWKFDPRSCLPVPRGGWNALPPSEWPESQGLGRRGVSSVNFGDTADSLSA